MNAHEKPHSRDEEHALGNPMLGSFKKLTLVGFKFLPPVILVAGIALAAGIYWRFTPVCQFVARFLEQDVWFDSSTIRLGTRTTGTVASESVAIRNYSDHPIDIVGVSLSCGCTRVSGVPCTIPESGIVRISIEITIARGKAVVKESAIFILNDYGTIKRYPVVIQGKVASPKES